MMTNTTAAAAAAQLSDEKFFLSHVSMFGSYAVLHKLGRKWAIQCRSVSCPTMFATKREAADRVSLMTCAIARRHRLDELKRDLAVMRATGASPVQIAYVAKCIEAFEN